MNWLDFVIIVLVVGFGWMGWSRGLMSLLLTLVGGIAGLFLAGRIYKSVAPLFAPISDSEGLQQLLAFILVFALMVAAGWIAAALLEAALRAVMLGWIDSLAGLVLGAVSGLIIAATIVTAMDALPFSPLDNAVKDSAIAPALIERFSPVKELLLNESLQMQGPASLAAEQPGG